MFYRLILKLLTNKKNGSIHSFAQTITFLFCKFYRLIPIKRSLPTSPVNVMGLSFANPVGLAAGFDRDGKLLPCSELIGCGFIEIGTINVDATKELDNEVITAIQNMNNAAKHEQSSNQHPRWGINLGSLRNTLDEKTVADYNKGMDLFWHHADYLVINLSRPENDVRSLDPDMNSLDTFLTNIKHHHSTLTSYHGYVPMLAKIAVDHVHNDHISTLLLLIRDHDFDGVILAFENWPDLKSVSDYLHTLKVIIGSFTLIVVGGIRSTEDMQQLMAAGASLVQIYTSLVQQGPLKTRKMITKLKS
jgi:dihydroorotate dehydrogenase